MFVRPLGLRDLVADDAFCRSADPRRANQCDFHGYVRGLCFLCQAGTYDQVLDFLFRVYSTAREERVIGRAELAAILENHVVYDDFEVGHLRAANTVACYSDLPGIS